MLSSELTFTHIFVSFCDYGNSKEKMTSKAFYEISL